jgi:hypothetical protein
MLNDNLTKYTLIKPDGRRRVGRPKLRWMDLIDVDLRVLNVRRWKRRALDRTEWKKCLGSGQVPN